MKYSRIHPAVRFYREKWAPPFNAPALAIALDQSFWRVAARVIESTYDSKLVIEQRSIDAVNALEPAARRIGRQESLAFVVAARLCLKFPTVYQTDIANQALYCDIFGV